VLLAIFLTGHRYASLIFDENGPIQLATAIFYLTGAGVAAVGLVQTKGIERAYFAVLGLLCLLFFGEETSWLQHQLGYVAPEFVASRNAQGEFNLHNLNVLHGGELFGGQGHLGWSTMLKSQHLFQLGFLVYFLALPVATLIRPAAALIAKLRMPYPGWRLVGSIWLTILLSIALTLLSGDTTKPLIAETRELIYAVSILAFVILWFSAMQARKVAIPEPRVKST
jgi:hypothetical protein